MPPAFEQGLAAARPPAWMGLLASLYGGITEEVLLRVFLMGVMAWLASRALPSKEALRPTAAWVAITVATVIFGLGHLPATASFSPLTGTVVLRALLLNGVGGMVFGWLYWRHSLMAAMVAHFTADLVLHVLVPLLGG